MTDFELLMANAKQVVLDRTSGGASSTLSVAIDQARDNARNPKYTARLGGLWTTITADEYRRLKEAKTDVPTLLEP